MMMRYRNQALGKLNLREKRKRYYPCPGFVGDRAGDPFGHRFERWHARPKASWRLYWRMHPQRYLWGKP